MRTIDWHTNVLRNAIETYGMQLQMDLMIEEMGELTQALIKYRRAAELKEKEAAVQHVREELADVSIMLQQLVMIFGPIKDCEFKKMERLAERLGMRLMTEEADQDGCG